MDDLHRRKVGGQAPPRPSSCSGQQCVCMVTLVTDDWSRAATLGFPTREGMNLNNQESEGETDLKSALREKV